MAKTPRLDGRSSAEIHDDVAARAPGYLDGWSPSADPVGDAMVTLFSEMAGTVAADLDGLPEKHFVAFLDRLGFDTAPPQRARLPLSVTVADGAGRNVSLPAGTRVTAVGPDGSDRTFELTPGEAFEATPANLTHGYTVDPARDRIHDVLSPLSAGRTVPLFGGENRQTHRLYLGHSEALTLDGGSRLLVEVTTSAPRTVFTRALRWEYFGTGSDDDTDEWRPLTVVGEQGESGGVESVTVEAGGATGSAGDGSSSAAASTDKPRSLLLGLPDDAEMSTTAVDGVETTWIRATLPAGTTFGDSVVVSGVRLGTGPVLRSLVPSNGGTTPPAQPPALTPDLMFHNDVELARDKPVYPFGEQPQRRDVFAVASREAFSKVGTSVTLSFEGAAGLFEEPRRLSWEYYDGDGWRLIPTVTRSGHQLSFVVPDDLAETSVVGQTGRWVRARLLDSEHGQVTYRRVPFEEYTSGTGEPNQTVEFETPPIDEISVFVEEEAAGNGPEWVEWTEVTSLDDSGPEDRHFEVDEGGGAVTFGDGSSGRIPPAGTDNIRATYRGGTYDWQLDGDAVPSFRSLTLDYGTEAAISLPPTVDAPDGTPRLHVVTPETVVCDNNRRYEAHLDADATWTEPIRPFAGLADETQTLYLGFDAPLTDGPIQLLVSLEEKLFTDRFDSRIRWEYAADRSGNEWEPITVRDETAGLTERGIVALSFPSATVPTGRFGVERHWIRARLSGTPFAYGAADVDAVDDGSEADDPSDPLAAATDGEPLQPCGSVVSTRPPLATPSETAPALGGLYPNTGWASNVRSVDAERLGSSDGTPEQTFTLRSTPATNVTVEIDELAGLTTDERAELAATRPENVTEQVDEGGDPVAFWVGWTAVPDLSEAGPNNRQYTFDWTTGTVRFGDGVAGRIPPVGRDNVRASYETGGGSAGNVAAGAVERLVSSVAFVEDVTNHEPADGGVDAETTAQVRRRGPRELRDRNRAVTAVDFERLATASSRRLARVKAIRGMDRAGDYTPGTLTLVIVPRTEAVRPSPSVELRRRVLDGVAAHAPATVTRDDRLVVRGPRFVAAAVSAALVVHEGASRSVVESTAREVVSAFLHPLTGGPDGTGWGFGELPCLSDLFALLEGVDDVDHVERLALTFAEDGGGRPLTLTPGDDDPAVAVDALVYSDEHDISVTGAV